MVTLHSLEELKEVFQEELKKQKLLDTFGIPCKEEDFDSLEIIEQQNSYIKVKDNKNHKIMYSDLAPCFFNMRYETKKFNPIVYYGEHQEDVTCDYYYSLQKIKNNHIKFSQIDTKERYKEENLLVKRAYRDVETKYGEFCLCIEENHLSEHTSKAVALYHGKAEDIMEHGFIEQTEFTVVKATNFEETGCYNRILGLDSGRFKQHRYIYSNIDQEGYAICGSDAPIYSAIIEHGQLKDKSKYYPNGLAYQFRRKVPELLKKDEEIISSAYFHDYRSLIFVKKNAEYMNLIVKGDCQRVSGYDILSLPTIAKENFSVEEIDMIIDAIKGYMAKFKTREDFFEKVINEMNHYKQIKEQNKEITLDFENPYNYRFNDFDQAVSYLKGCDAVDIAEKMIENSAETNHMTIDELLGDKKQIGENKGKVKENKQKFNDRSGIL